MLFWTLDRGRWRALRRTATYLRMEFDRHIPSEILQEYQDEFQLFGSEKMLTFSAFFNGQIGNRKVQVFNFSMEDLKPDAGYRKGYFCFLFETHALLPEAILWPREEANPFGTETRSLDGFLPNSALLKYYKIWGRNGKAIAHLLNSSFGEWLQSQRDALVEFRCTKVLIGLKGEINPQQLGEQLLELATVFDDLETKMAPNNPEIPGC